MSENRLYVTSMSTGNVVRMTGTKCPDCERTLTPEVLRSNAGFYVGSSCGCGPYDRYTGYTPDRSVAEQVLASFVKLFAFGFCSECGEQITPDEVKAVGMCADCFGAENWSEAAEAAAQSQGVEAVTFANACPGDQPVPLQQQDIPEMFCYCGEPIWAEEEPLCTACNGHAERLAASMTPDEAIVYTMKARSVMNDLLDKAVAEEALDYVENWYWDYLYYFEWRLFSLNPEIIDQVSPF